MSECVVIIQSWLILPSFFLLDPDLNEEAVQGWQWEPDHLANPRGLWGAAAPGLPPLHPLSAHLCGNSRGQHPHPAGCGLHSDPPHTHVLFPLPLLPAGDRYTSNIMPRLLWSFLEGRKTISVVSCLLQFYLFASLAAVECLLLSVMSFDRYLAICHPLHYPALMSTWLCGYLAAGAWFSGFSFSAFTLALATPLTLCPGSREINHYFCDFTPVVGLFCGDVGVMWGAGVSISGFLTLAPFLLIVASYAFILRTVLHIPSGHGKQKAFSTCSSHLSVVGVF